jgi:hypothetical protein
MAYCIVTSSMALPQSGKWYCEFEFDGADAENDDHFYIGIIDVTQSLEAQAYDSHAKTIQWAHAAANSSNGLFVDEGSSTYNNSAIRLTAGEIGSIAVDMDNEKLWFAQDGTWYDDDGSTDGDPANGTNPTATLTTGREYTFFCGGGSGNTNVLWNFGNPHFSISSGNNDGNGYGNFEYAVPSGFYALCTQNLAKYG